MNDENICDEKLCDKQIVGGVKARFQNNNLHWNQTMWIDLALTFSTIIFYFKVKKKVECLGVVCIPKMVMAIMNEECFKWCILCVLFFYVYGFCCSWMLGVIRGCGIYYGDWWNNIWSKTCDGKNK